MKEVKQLYQHKDFNIVEIENTTGILHKYVNVAIMPFILNDYDIIDKIMISKEKNYFRDSDECFSLLTGVSSDTDETLLDTAINTFNVKEVKNSDWIYLGTCNVSKTSDEKITMFAVNVTQYNSDDIIKTNPTLEIVSINDLIEIDELLVQSSFLRLFNFSYQKTINNV